MKDQPPGTFTTIQLARVLGVTEQSVTTYARKGIISKMARGLFPVTSVAQVVAHLHKVIEGKGGGQGAATADQRRELIAEKTKIAKLERQQLEGSLIDKRLIEDALARIRFAERNAWLGLPSRIAPQLANRPTPEVYKTLADFVHEMLDGLSRTEIDVDDTDEEDPEVESDATPAAIGGDRA
jgi:phage terminase Nu1 subunit (DNA packaging protein)